jgi:hypothetical protein
VVVPVVATVIATVFEAAVVTVPIADVVSVAVPVVAAVGVTVLVAVPVVAPVLEAGLILDPQPSAPVIKNAKTRFSVVRFILVTVLSFRSFISLHIAPGQTQCGCQCAFFRPDEHPPFARQTAIFWLNI